ncbi:MAG: hypothetical protein RI907_3699, partial [Pseudomonadota bacterium]
FQLVAAMNPCPCGHHGNPLKACRCTPEQVARYQGRLSGPLLDRIDIQIEVPTLPPEVLACSPAGEASAQVAERVSRARDRQWQRQGGPNAALAGQALDTHARAEEAALAFLRTACTRMGWSGRAYHRVIKLALTIADLAGDDWIRLPHMAEAIQYRRLMQPS